MIQVCKWLLHPLLRYHICPLVLPLLLCKLSSRLLWTFLKDTQEAVSHLSQIQIAFARKSQLLAHNSTLLESKEAEVTWL